MELLLQLTLVLLFKLSIVFSAQNTLYVWADKNSSHCDNGQNIQCLLLEDYIRNVSMWFNSNTVMVLMDGNHSLDTVIKVRNCQNFTITGNGNASHSIEGLPQPTAWINCIGSPDSGIHFMNSSNIRVHNLGLRSCGVIETFGRYNISAALSFRLVANVNITQFVTSHGLGFGIYTQNIYGFNKVQDSAFLHSIKNKCNQYTDSGNAKFSFEENSNVETSLVINSSFFMYGGKHGFYKAAGGLSIYINHTGVNVNIINITAHHNIGSNSGNVALLLTTEGSKIVINHSRITDGRAFKGGGLRFWYKQNQYAARDSCSRKVSHVLTITNTIFEGNLVKQTGGAMYVAYYNNNTLDDYDCNLRKVVIRNCTFIKNGGNGAAMEIILHRLTDHYSMPMFRTSIEKSSFEDNFLPTNVDGPVIDLISVDVSVRNCTFIRSNTTVISLRNTYLNLYGSSNFENNTAEIGGAFKVCEASLIFGHINTTVSFVNNSAKKGGAIYVQEVCRDTFPLCFFQPSVPRGKYVVELPKLFQFTFTNNSAKLAGDNLYGGDVDQCYTMVPQVWNSSQSYYKYWYFKEIFTKVFVIAERGPSWISSNARRVCFCNKSQDNPCITKVKAFKQFPGERFTVSVIAVGQMNGSTLGMINTRLVNDDHQSHTFVRIDQPTTEAKAACVEISFTIYSNRSTAKISFTPETSNKAIWHYKRSVLNLTISLSPCPFGFKLTQTTPYECICDPLLSKIQKTQTVLCNISNQSLSVHQRRVWLGCLDHVLESDSFKVCNSLIISYDCGYYCAEAVRVLNSSALDSQCLPGHTGTLCGACKPGYSRVLGHKLQCHENCSYINFPFLLVFFLASGVLLVVFIMALNLTITEGTLNGILVYSMVIQSQGFFPENLSGFGKVCWIFVSWINLELGIEACFYKNMNAYQQVWISFILIFYFISIQIIIIYLNRRFLFFTRLFGRNVIKTLATVFILVYSNIVSTSLRVIHFAALYVSDPNKAPRSILVWYYDGNIPYLGPKHAPLFVMALVFYISALFFVFSLLLIQWLQKRSSFWYLRWVVRLRPFYEAYTGPCHDNYRFWPGFLILTRTGLYAVNNFYVAHTGSVAHIKMFVTAAICIVVMSMACIFPHGVYKKWLLNVLEFSFLLNICITSGILGITQKKHIKSQVVYTSVTISAIIFLGILVYHFHSQLREKTLWKKLITRFSIRRQNIKSRKVQMAEDIDHKLHMQSMSKNLPPVVHFDQCREPLMDS